MGDMHQPPSTDDIRNVYRLFLGREPETPGAVAAKAHLSRGELLCEVMSSEEFLEGVQEPLLRSRPEASSRLDAVAPPDLGVWIADFLWLEAPVSRLTRPHVWGSLLATLMEIPQFLRHCSLNPFTDEEEASLQAWRERAKHAGLRGGLEILDPHQIGGWALDTADPDRSFVVHVYIAGIFVGALRPDQFRRDLQDAYGGPGNYGFTLDLRLTASDFQSRPLIVELREALSGAVLARGELVLHDQERLDALHEIASLLDGVRGQLRRIEAALPAARGGAAFSLRSYDAYWRAFYAPLPQDRLTERDAAASWSFIPSFGIVVLGAEHRAADSARTLRSLEDQSYDGWKVLPPGDSGAARSCDYVIRIPAGDALAPDALFRLGSVLQSADKPLVLYTDEDFCGIDFDGRPTFDRPRFRGDFDPLLVLQHDQLGGLLAVSRVLLESLRGDDGSKSPDGFIYAHIVSAAAGASKVRHLPRVLYHRHRKREDDPATLAKRREAVARYVESLGQKAEVASAVDVLGAPLPGMLRIRARGSQARRATVIIPTRDRRDLLQPCVEGLLATRGDNATPFNLLIVDNASSAPEALEFLDTVSRDQDVRVVRDASTFNWARLNNMAAQETKAEVLVFLNNDTAPLARDWCDELSLWASWPKVGVVGTRLVYGDGTLQHAGVVTGAWGLAAHEGVGAKGFDPGYEGRYALTRCASAVTGACMAVRREVFTSLGGFDARFAVNYSDVDFCLRVRTQELHVVYAPQAAFHHFESKTRRFDANLEETERVLREEEGLQLRALWGDQLGRDPFYNPHFERFAPPFTRLRAPPE